ncbi:MAG: sigma-54-dependent Fis family transcriptional regulator [Planctomycetes bacterium]|nr:sigma-54-dependent Fis family transcriptional regulator [Planctomycetota bacterium]
MSAARHRVLVVDDEPVIRSSLAECLEGEGFDTAVASTGEEAVLAVEQGPVDLVLCDLQLPGINGIETIDRILARDPGALVVLMTAYGTVETAVSAFQRGAHDYLLKPVILDEVLARARRLLEHRETLRENQRLRRELTRVEQAASTGRLVGQGAVMRGIRTLIGKIGPARSTVLILGESGTGKELAARALHELGEKARDPAGKDPGRFLAVNCAAIPGDLLENQLFGHRRGAFTSADRDQAGLFVHAGKGTVFLDEIGELPLATQAKLLRAIEQREVLPVGANEPVRVEARVLAATNKDLQAEIEANRFRSDLYYRLNVVSLRMPSLRERREDIPELAEHLLARHAGMAGKRFQGISRQAMALLREALWKGNVRELDNVLQRAVILGDGPLVEPHDLPADLVGESIDPSAVDSLPEAVRRFERMHIERLLRECPDKREAARRMEIGLSSLYRRMGDLGIDLEAGEE